MTSKVSCHCGKVTATIQHDPHQVTAWDCNCSDCSMRGNVHFMVTKLKVGEAYLENTTLYEWGTKTAKRRFCKTCGILPWYTPRSNPDGFGITLKCVIEWSNPKPKITMKHFDGVHWEESYASTSIAKETERWNESTRVVLHPRLVGDHKVTQQRTDWSALSV